MGSSSLPMMNLFRPPLPERYRGLSSFERSRVWLRVFSSGSRALFLWQVLSIVISAVAFSVLTGTGLWFYRGHGGTDMQRVMLIACVTLWPAVYLLCHRLVVYPQLRKAMERVLGEPAPQTAGSGRED